jgi:hypothetical protein
VGSTYVSMLTLFSCCWCPQVNELGPVTKVGTGRRLGPLATEDQMWTPPAYAAATAAAGAADGSSGGEQQQQQQEEEGGAAAGAAGSSSSSSGVPTVHFAKRKRPAAASTA